MGKRPADEAVSELQKLKNGERSGSTANLGEAAKQQPQEGMGEFEDAYEDEIESEEDVVDAGGAGDDEDEDEDAGVTLHDDDEDEDEAMDVDKEVYHPSRPPRPLTKDEILEPDMTAYEMFHNVTVKWPSLSFEILPDKLGDDRRTYPMTMYLVSGTQAERNKDNELTITKLSGMGKARQENPDNDDDDDDDDNDNGDDDDPILESKHVPVPSTTNRLRVSPHAPTTNEYLTATMLENGNVNVYDIAPQLRSLDTPGYTVPPSALKPLQSLKMHRSVEGYAVDWSPLVPQGKLLTGDNSGKIFHTTRNEGGSFVTDSSPFTGHTSSIEELQWSPSERTVFASASADGTVKIWDIRQKPRKHAFSVEISSSDVNVASWNPAQAHFLATGADDGVWAVWDLRTFSSAAKNYDKVDPVASFTWHQEPITSIEWHPKEDSIVAVASADNTVTLWELAVEEDSEEMGGSGMKDVPEQLLFVHVLDGVKEVHWSKQMPGTVVGTGAEGFGVFKTISV